jgi:hypothetical protein
VQVVGRPIAVERDADLDAQLAEQLTEAPGQQHAIGLDAHVDRAYPIQWIT